ncbi:DUF4411 family protein [Roseateles noduli]|uniref:DUF4411 family protein n=1 Tax=Roseateles noduli TaxID=2052484 RepID=UPI003D654115
MAYLLDANALLEAKNVHYGMDFCPAFWRWLTVSHADGQVFSITQVRDELLEDVIRPWVNAQSSGFFLSEDLLVEEKADRIVEWLDRQSLLDAVILEFVDSADMYLVAHALAHGHTVVTREKPAAESKKKLKIKIPDVCTVFGVRCIEPHVMLRELQARFVLGPIHEPYEGANLAKVDTTQPSTAALGG